MTPQEKEINRQTIQNVKKRQLRGKQIRAQEAAERANILRPEVRQAIAELNKSQPDKKTRDLVEKRSLADTTYWKLVSACKTSRGISWLEAIRAVEKETDPEEHARLKKEALSQVNASPKSAKSFRSEPTIDGQTFEQMVTDRKNAHGMTTWEAHRSIDREHPGFRQKYLDWKNK